MSAPCKFLVLDGVEGCGKSTQAALLAEHLERAGQPVLLTREPGGTALGQALRRLLLQDDLAMSPLAETFLFCADRAEHVAEVVVPALRQGQWVVCDRFSSATYAYQVHAGGVDAVTFSRLDAVARRALFQVPGREEEGDQPDLTLILDLEPEAGLRRALGEDPSRADNMESRSLEFHQRVREGFLHYAELLGARAAVLDGASPAPQVHRAVLAALGLTS